MAALGEWWHGFECCRCKVVFDVRTEDKVLDTAHCPVCTNPCDLRGRWQADENGYGSRGDGTGSMAKKT